jgi:hypothetical protein
MRIALVLSLLNLVCLLGLRAEDAIRASRQTEIASELSGLGCPNPPSSGSCWASSTAQCTLPPNEPQCTYQVCNPANGCVPAVGKYQHTTNYNIVCQSTSGMSGYETTDTVYCIRDIGCACREKSGMYKCMKMRAGNGNFETPETVQDTTGDTCPPK